MLWCGLYGKCAGRPLNKKVFADAGITELPKTPDEFIADLQLIKDNTDAIPLYTNYAAGWTMGGAWDGYLGAITTGDTAWLNQKFTHGGAFQGQRGRNRRLRTVQDPL